MEPQLKSYAAHRDGRDGRFRVDDRHRLAVQRAAADMKAFHPFAYKMFYGTVAEA